MDSPEPDGRIPSGDPGVVGGASSLKYRRAVAGWMPTRAAISTALKPSPCRA
jgi:hypothetical protein